MQLDLWRAFDRRRPVPQEVWGTQKETRKGRTAFCATADWRAHLDSARVCETGRRTACALSSGERVGGERKELVADPQSRLFASRAIFRCPTGWFSASSVISCSSAS